MNWFRTWRRRKDRETLSEFKTAIASPENITGFGSGTSNVRTWPGPGRLAVRPDTNISAGSFTVGTGDGDVFGIPDMVANVVRPVAWIEQGETLTMTNVDGSYHDVLDVGVLDNFGGFHRLWRLNFT